MHTEANEGRTTANNPSELHERANICIHNAKLYHVQNDETTKIELNHRRSPGCPVSAVQEVSQSTHLCRPAALPPSPHQDRHW